jgi:DNA-binding PadR family transcriptional regulator
MSRPLEGHIPQASLSIMLALSLRPRHGYEIMQQVAKDTDNGIQLTAGTLYSSIKRLAELNFIEEVPFTAHNRRRQYRLTHKGWQILHDEYIHYEQLVRLAQERKVL